MSNDVINLALHYLATIQALAVRIISIYTFELHDFNNSDQIFI